MRCEAETEEALTLAAIESVGEALMSVWGDRLHEGVCVDTAEISFRLFTEEVGLNAVMVGAYKDVLGPLGTRPTCSLGHEWVRIGDLNVDYAARQFGIEKYPFVTFKWDDRAIGLYGSGSVKLERGYKTKTKAQLARDEQALYPPVRLVDLAAKGGKVYVKGVGYRDLHNLWREEYVGETMLNILVAFRNAMERRGFSKRE